jgi:hypothetical protein
MAAATGLIDAAEATHNPFVLSFALYVHDHAFRDADPVAAQGTLRRGLVIAQDSGNRFTESLLAASLSRREAVYGDPLAALDHVTLAIRTYHDAGSITVYVIAAQCWVAGRIEDAVGYSDAAQLVARRPRDPRRRVRPARTL